MSNLTSVFEKWEPVIGLEVHAQLSTNSKMFCGCKNMYGSKPNSNICPTCLGLPGALPVANAEAIKYALKLGIALGSNITKFSRFARKNYFYPDLTKGYQISQYDEPICQGGKVTIRKNGFVKNIELTRIHLEEDAGKSIHAKSGNGTQVDFNRCGVPLVEIVTEPVIQNPYEARVYLVRLKQILEYLDICDCNLEEGKFRCDANVSIRPKGESQLGTKTEMKNMNSFRGVERGLSNEIIRQAKILENGDQVEQVTLLWNETTQRAEIMRTKEDAHDYRYFPDPDLVPLLVSDGDLIEAKASISELPFEKEERFVKEYDLRLEDALILTSDYELSNYYEKSVRAGASPDHAAKWILGEVLGIINDENITIDTFGVTPDRFAGLLISIKMGKINNHTGKEVLRKMLLNALTADEIIQQEGLIQVSDKTSLGKIVLTILKENPGELQRYRSGKKTLFGFFMGEVMKVTKGKSDPKILKDVLISALEASK
ncbi:MAG: Asp-tRNA(Asn)/Glu-tRNA(Gln) amidotransferase GatCAB subunit B [Candidatus Marinimicrobia bacterium]|nr:Asp-tRNA(Asn)/Glu-tRNA(Gln) amidotransferase GatCAB subunit B [Candidatus Neomarinimicrobiota bacterium]|tara:strand:+ start:687 stop:2147 length:1461 start_codon:yes stop_codon:yes gene_type:complete